MNKLMSIQEVIKARQPIIKQIVPPPVVSNPWGEEKPILSNSQKAQMIMEANGLDGLEMGDHPLHQMIERPSVYEIILNLFANGWSYERIADWCRYAKWSCTFTLNGKIVR